MRRAEIEAGVISWDPTTEVRYEHYGENAGRRRGLR
jgi:hypothetical protein